LTTTARNALLSEFFTALKTDGKMHLPEALQAAKRRKDHVAADIEAVTQGLVRLRAQQEQSRKDLSGLHDRLKQSAHAIVIEHGERLAEDLERAEHETTVMRMRLSSLAKSGPKLGIKTTHILGHPNTGRTKN